MKMQSEDEDDGYVPPAVMLDRIVTDEHLEAAVYNLAELSSKSVMAARTLVMLKCGPKVSAADAAKAAEENVQTSVFVVPPKPSTKRGLEILRRYLSPEYKLGDPVESDPDAEEDDDEEASMEPMDDFSTLPMSEPSTQRPPEAGKAGERRRLRPEDFTDVNGSPLG